MSKKKKTNNIEKKKHKNGIEIHELLHHGDTSEESSDSEQHEDLAFQNQWKFERTEGDKSRLKEIIVEINTKIANKEPIDLNEYPPLFIVHYRGVHFFKQYLNQGKRREIRNLIKNDDFKSGIYSPAVYELAGLAIGEAIDTKEKKKRIRKAVKTLNESFEEFSEKPAEIAWWGTDMQHEKLIHQHYQRYVNNYAEFREESKNKTFNAYKNLSSTANPYISTADQAKHAVLYALGGKAKASQGCLRPGYIESKPKHPKVGYVQIIFHKLTSLTRNKPMFLSVLHASKKIDIKDRLLNERETTFKTSIAKKHIVHTQVVRFPAFNVDYNQDYHSSKYGITQKSSYSRYKNVLSKNEKNTTLLEKIADHYALQLTNKAYQIANKQKGFIVYIGLDGRLTHILPTTLDIRDTRKKKMSLEQTFKTNLNQYQTSELESISDEETDELSTEVQSSSNKEKGFEKKEFNYLNSISQQTNFLDTVLIDEQLLLNGLYRGMATIEGNNCLLHSYFQLIQDHLESELGNNLGEFRDFFQYIRQRIGKTKNEMLMINDEEQGIQILSAIKAYIEVKLSINVGFDLQFLIAMDGGIAIVDNLDEFQNQFSEGEYVIPIKIIQVNYNHYEPVRNTFFMNQEEDLEIEEIEEDSQDSEEIVINDKPKKNYHRFFEEAPSNSSEEKEDNTSGNALSFCYPPDFGIKK